MNIERMVESTSREKSIINVLMFGNGYVLHHSRTAFPSMVGQLSKLSITFKSWNTASLMSQSKTKLNGILFS